MDLFSEQQKNQTDRTGFVPLAERCRPLKLSDFVGHQDILGSETILRKEIEKSQIRSMILWGPPGVGKTTLAGIIAREVNAEFRGISAVAAGVKEVRQIIENAARLRKYSGKNTILFIDEIHRFNKAQQDALLQAVEEGTVRLIGATTENPSFEIISPLLSRSHVYQMKPLIPEQIRQIVQRALRIDDSLKTKKIVISDWEALYQLADGDARRALNLLEKALDLFPAKTTSFELNKAILQKAATRKILSYDKSGEFHYDLASAFIKSLRGSDPDAAVYWMARMLEAGEDPKFIARRMLILASEDIGNADPLALVVATNGFTAINYVGMPEAKIILSQVATYLAAAPKSNTAIMAINEAITDLKKFADLPVPLHLRNAPTNLLADLGYGKEYQYAHNFENHFIKEKYLPPELENRIYYSPSEQGAEAAIKERLQKLWRGIKKYKQSKKKTD
ncbi:MAG: replication-associated recombination protein A [Calditrichia bacterium]|nr:replication-associated recombination protein A [Calditrichia bacterium]